MTATRAPKTKTQADMSRLAVGSLRKLVTKMWRRSTESLLVYRRQISQQLWVTVSQQVCSLVSACGWADWPICSTTLSVLPLLSLAATYRKLMQPATKHFSHIQYRGWRLASDFIYRFLDWRCRFVSPLCKIVLSKNHITNVSMLKAFFLTWDGWKLMTTFTIQALYLRVNGLAFIGLHWLSRHTDGKARSPVPTLQCI
jgi:hypothetical protein